MDHDSNVSLLHGEPVVGTVVCDDIEIIYKDQLRKHAGGLTGPAFAAVEDGLRAALGLRY